MRPTLVGAVASLAIVSGLGISFLGLCLTAEGAKWVSIAIQMHQRSSRWRNTN
jgi:hypothetical protein